MPYLYARMGRRGSLGSLVALEKDVWKMNLGRVIAGVGGLILAFLLLSRFDGFTKILNVAGARFLDIVGTLQGREVTSGTGRSIGGIAK